MNDPQPMPGLFARAYWTLFCMVGIGKTLYITNLRDLYKWIGITYGNTHLFYWAEHQGYISIRELTRKRIGITPLVYPKDIKVRTRVDTEGNLKFRGRIKIISFASYIQKWSNSKYDRRNK
jgi:hypothetical protein